MVKKLKYLLFFIPFLFIENTYALNLGVPETYTYFTDGSQVSGNATSIGYWGSENYWVSPTKLGSFTNASPNAHEVLFFWNSANLCQNKDISISGTIAVLNDFFTEQTYNARIVMNGENLSCSFTQENSSRIRYTCFGHGGGHFQIFFYETSFYGSYRNYDIAVSKSVDLSCDVSNQAIVNQSIQNTQSIINNQNSNTNSIIQNEQQNSQNIINNQNSNTNSIIQDNQQNTQDIIDNQSQNTQDIIDNQNQNSQQQIESQKVCTTISKNNVIQEGKYIYTNGTYVNDINFGYTDYFYIKNSKINVLQVGNQYWNNQSYCFYDENKTLISCTGVSNLSLGELNIPNGAYYFRTSIMLSQDKPQFEICKNGNQALNDSVNNLTDSITSESDPNTNQDINDMNNMVASDTPISDLITMPLTLINAYINGVNASCSPINLGNLYGTNLVLPCINLEQRLGSNLWHIIDAFFSIFMCYNIGMLFISAFDGITSLRDDFEGLYQPRHADTGYSPKHGG